VEECIALSWDVAWRRVLPCRVVRCWSGWRPLAVYLQCVLCQQWWLQEPAVFCIQCWENVDVWPCVHCCQTFVKPHGSPCTRLPDQLSVKDHTLRFTLSCWLGGLQVRLICRQFIATHRICTQTCNWYRSSLPLFYRATKTSQTTLTRRVDLRENILTRSATCYTIQDTIHQCHTKGAR